MHVAVYVCAAETGIEPPLNELYPWGGLFAPAGLPDDVRDTLPTGGSTSS